MIRKNRVLCVIMMSILLSACATAPTKDYSRFREADPRSILIVPVVNRSVCVDAPDYFLSTISRPVAERGYYVFPVNMVKRLMEDDGLSDANMVHDADPTRLAEIFDADAVLYVIIERWDARYLILSTTVTVEFTYYLRSGITGEELWRNHEIMQYQPSQTSGDPLVMLISAAVTAALTKAMPNYIPLAQQANAMAVCTPHKGLPAGCYDKDYGSDTSKF